MSFIKKLLLYCFVLNCSLFFGQETKDLSQLSYESISDTINKYIYSDLSKTVEASNAFILKGKREKDKKKEWVGIHALGTSYEIHREYDKAQVQFEKALILAQENKLDEEIIGSYYLGAKIQMGLSNASKTLELLDNALLLAEEIDNENWRENILQFISYILQMSGDTQKAIQIRKKSISIYKIKPLDSAYTVDVKNKVLVNSYSQLSGSFLKLKEADSAKHYVSLISNIVTPQDSCNQRVLYLTKGEINFFEKNYSEAKKNFIAASKLCDLNSSLLDLRMNYALGKVAHGEGSFKEAKIILQQALDNYDVKPSEEGYMDDYYKLLADSYKETGDLEKANYYFEKYIHSTSEFDKLKSDVKALTKAQEIEKFRSELKSLEAEKNEKQTYLNFLFLGASIIILILLFILLRFYRNKKANELKFEALLSKMNHSSERELAIIDTKDEVLEEKNSNDVPDDIKQQILDGLKKLEEKEYFLKQECSSYNVSKKINTNTSYLSKVINSHYGKNFNTYINDLRINYTIVRLKNDVIFRSYSIQSIAEEVGYKSADSFTKYFKKDTGLNPSFYIKEIKNIA